MGLSLVFFTLCIFALRVQSRVGVPLSTIGVQTADVRLINNCDFTVWFEARQGGSSAPLPGEVTTMIQAPSQTAVDYTIPATGLSATRFWAKYGCNGTGMECIIGDSQTYWPSGACPAGGCNPPIDSLFEATFGCQPSESCYATNPTTWLDASQVDGFTFPYRLTASGKGLSQCDSGFTGIDGSHLDLTKCPSDEDLSEGGLFPDLPTNSSQKITSVNLRVLDSQNQVIGCMSPCKKLNYSPPWGYYQNEYTQPTIMMCCPTTAANPCEVSSGCVSSEACSSGPIVNTQWVKAIHTMAPGIYAYAYDDANGLHTCPSGTVIYTMTFCPAGGAAYPVSANTANGNGGNIISPNSAVSMTPPSISMMILTVLGMLALL